MRTLLPSWLRCVTSFEHPAEEPTVQMSLLRGVPATCPSSNFCSLQMGSEPGVPPTEE